MKMGDIVRISKTQGAFDRGYTTKWTRELFKVRGVFDTIVPMVYALDDYAGEELKGTFYRQELQKVSEPDTFEIEDVIQTRRRKGKKEFLVKWRGYPDSFNSWVAERDMIDTSLCQPVKSESK